MRNYLSKKTNSNIFSIFDEFFNRDFFDRGDLRNFMGNYSIEKISDTNHIIYINVAGFNKNDIEIIHENGYLYIKGEKKEINKDNQYIYNGFSSTFSNSFALSQDAEILNASLNNGMLSIEIKEKIHKANSKRILIK